MYIYIEIKTKIYNIIDNKKRLNSIMIVAKFYNFFFVSAIGSIEKLAEIR